MGDFRITIEALGGHGCQREIKDGGHVVGCERRDCPDCMARELVRRMKRAGMTLHKAEIVHWPHDFVPPHGGTPTYSLEQEVRDDLLTGQRHGSF